MRNKIYVLQQNTSKLIFHINWQSSMWCDKERKKLDQNNAKTSMKAACSWISYDNMFSESQFSEKPTLENNLVPA